MVIGLWIMLMWSVVVYNETRYDPSIKQIENAPKINHENQS